MKRAKMLQNLAKSSADRVPLRLDPKVRAGVIEVMYDALRLIWARLNARERGAVAKDPQKLGTHLVLQIVDPATKKARPATVIADRVLSELRPATTQIKAPKGRRKGWRERSRPRSRTSATPPDA